MSTLPRLQLARTVARAAAALGFAAAACGPSADEARFAAADTASWRLSERPALHVGTDGQALDRVYGGLIQGDGSVVIGNSGTGELQFFDPAGQLAHVAGRRGAGPGEFLGINWIGRFRGDSLLVFDLRAQRFSVWSRAGGFGRVFGTGTAQGAVRPITVFTDGTLLLASVNQYDPRGSSGVVRDEMVLSLVTTSGSPVGSLGHFAGAEWLLFRDASSFRATQLPFGKVGYVAAGRDHVAYASSEAPSVALYDRSGRLVRTIDVSAAARRLRPSEIDSVLREMRDEGERQEVRRQLRSRRKGLMAPVITDLRMDDAGDLWVRTPGSVPGVSRWAVFSLAGQAIGSVLMPEAYTPLDVLDSRLLLREVDGDGVQSVSVREVAR